jgi:hypothetical protein
MILFMHHSLRATSGKCMIHYDIGGIVQEIGSIGLRLPTAHVVPWDIG